MRIHPIFWLVFVISSVCITGIGFYVFSWSFFSLLGSLSLMGGGIWCVAKSFLKISTDTSSPKISPKTNSSELSADLFPPKIPLEMTSAVMVDLPCDKELSEPLEIIISSDDYGLIPSGCRNSQNKQCFTAVGEYETDKDELFRRQVLSQENLPKVPEFSTKSSPFIEKEKVTPSLLDATQQMVGCTDSWDSVLKGKPMPQRASFSPPLSIESDLQEPSSPHTLSLSLVLENEFDEFDEFYGLDEPDESIERSSPELVPHNLELTRIDLPPESLELSLPCALMVNKALDETQQLKGLVQEEGQTYCVDGFPPEESGTKPSGCADNFLPLENEIKTSNFRISQEFFM